MRLLLAALAAYSCQSSRADLEDAWDEDVELMQTAGLKPGSLQLGMENSFQFYSLEETRQETQDPVDHIAAAPSEVQVSVNDAPAFNPTSTGGSHKQKTWTTWRKSSVDEIKMAHELRFVVVSIPIDLANKGSESRASKIFGTLKNLSQFVNGPKPVAYTRKSSNDDYFNQMMTNDEIAPYLEELKGGSNNTTSVMTRLKSALIADNNPWWMRMSGVMKGALRMEAYRRVRTKVVAVCITDPALDDPISQMVAQAVPEIVGQVAADMASIDPTEPSRPSDRFVVLNVKNMLGLREALSIHKDQLPKVITKKHFHIPTNETAAKFIVIAAPTKDKNQKLVKNQLASMALGTTGPKLALDFENSTDQTPWNDMMRKIGNVTSALFAAYGKDPSQEFPLALQMHNQIMNKLAYGWWMRNSGMIKGALMAEALKPDGSVLYAICIKGGLVSDAQCMQSRALAAEVRQDLKELGMNQAQHWVKVMSFKSWEDFRRQVKLGGLLATKNFA